MQCRALSLLAVLLVGACHSPTAPPQPAASSTRDLTGAVWTGFFRIATCSASTPCPAFVDWMYAFTLEIGSAGNTVVATLQSSTPDAYVASLTGRVEKDGTHVFSGVSTNGRVDIRELRIRKDRAAVITGTMSYVAGIGTRETRTLTSTIPSATLEREVRQPVSAGSLAGTWNGLGRTDSCSGPICGFVATPGPFTITIDGSGLAALIESNIWTRTVVSLQGSAQPDGSVRFSGPWISAQAGRGGEFRHLTLRADPTVGLTGSFEFFETANTGPTTRLGSVLSASRVEVFASPGTFQGSWRGSYVPLSCTGDCNFVGIGSARGFHMVLTQVGASVRGNLLNEAAVPLTGTTSGESASFGGEVIVEPCNWDFEGSTCTQRIRNLAVTVDRFGQMRGTFEYFKEGWSGNLHYRYTVIAELRDVVVQP